MRFPVRFLFIIFFLFLLSTFYLQFSVTPVYAASQPTPAQPTQYIPTNTNPDVPNNLHNYTQNVMIEVMASLTCQLTGVDPINPKGQCLGVDQTTGKIGFVQGGGGAIGVMGNMISMLYTPPLHTSDYFQNLAANFGIGKKTYAQSAGLPAEASAKAGGTGFQSLTPLINIWSAFRNVVYLILVIIFVAIGLAIMLRIKIDPRTVMSIQNQIPKIIIGILAVTFSFAIAGFLIDLMWILIYLFYGIFTGIPGVDVSNLNPATIQGQNALRVAGHISAPGGIFTITHATAYSVKEVLHDILNIKVGVLEIFNPFSLVTVDLWDPTKRGSVANWIIDLLSLGAGFGAFKYVDGIQNIKETVAGIPFGIGGLLKSFVGINQFGTALVAGEAAYAGTESLLRNWLPYLIAYLIIFIALLTALFRLWFTLLMAYVYILLDVVLAPFWIIGGIVPGSPISFGGWIRDIAANLLAFPATIAMFMLGKVFMDSFGKTPATGGQNFVPPLIGNPGDPSAIGALIGLGILLMTPNVVNMLKQMLKAPKVDTSGIGRAIGVPIGAPGAMISKAGQLGLSVQGIKGLSGLPIVNKIFGKKGP